MLLILRLPVSNQPGFCQQDEQIKGIEANLDCFIHHKHMAPVLFPAADLVLDFEDQDTLLLQHSIGFSQRVTIESEQLILI